MAGRATITDFRSGAPSTGNARLGIEIDASMRFSTTGTLAGNRIANPFEGMRKSLDLLNQDIARSLQSGPLKQLMMLGSGQGRNARGQFTSEFNNNTRNALGQFTGFANEARAVLAEIQDRRSYARPMANQSPTRRLLEQTRQKIDEALLKEARQQLREIGMRALGTGRNWQFSNPSAYVINRSGIHNPYINSNRGWYQGNYSSPPQALSGRSYQALGPGGSRGWNTYSNSYAQNRGWNTPPPNPGGSMGGPPTGLSRFYTISPPNPPPQYGRGSGGYNPRAAINPYDNNPFGRTFVAMSLLHGMQRGGRAMFNTAQAGNILTTRLGQIAPITGQGSAAGRGNFRNEAKTLGFQTGTSFQSQLQGFERILESGGNISTKDTARIQRQSAKIAKITGQDQGAITDILMSAINSFGIKGNEIDRFANMMYLSRTKGRIEFGEMQTGIGKMFAAGKMAGFKGLDGPNGLNAIMAMIAGSTREGGSPSNNVTQAAQFLQKAFEPGSLKKLEKIGITGTPGEILNQIFAREKQSRAAGGQSFISSSGIFTTARGSRGGTVLASQVETFNQLMTESVTNVNKLSDAFDQKMDSPEARLDRMVSLANSFADAIGQDAVRAVDDLVKPLFLISDTMEKINKLIPGAQSGAGRSAGAGVIGGLAGLGEIAALIPMIGLGSGAISTLLGTHLDPLQAGANASWKTRVGVGAANIGGNMSAAFNSMMGISNATLIQNRERLQAYASPNFIGPITPGIAKGATKGVGLNGAVMGLMVAAAVKWIYDSAVERVKQDLVAQQGVAQTSIEGSITNGLQSGGFRRTLLETRTGVKSGKILRGTAKQTIISALEGNPDLMKRLNVELSDYREGAERTVTINGKLATSFEEINKALEELSTKDIQKQMRDVMAQQAIIQGLDQQRVTAGKFDAGADPMQWLQALGGGAALQASLFMGRDVQNQVAGNILDTFNFNTGQTGIHFEDNQRAQLLAEHAREIGQLKQEQEYAESPEGIAAEMKTKLDAIRDAQDSRLEAARATAKLEGEIAGLSQEEVVKKIKQAEIDTNISMQLDIVNAGAEDWAVYMEWVTDQTPEWKKNNQDIVEYQKQVAQALKKWQESIAQFDLDFAKIDKSLEQANRTFEYYNQKLAAQSAFKTAKISTFEGIAGLLTSGLPGEVQPLASAMAQNKFAQINLGASLTDFGLQADANAAEMDWIDVVLNEKANMRGKNLPEDFIGPQQTNIASLISGYKARTAGMSLDEKMNENGGTSWQEYLKWQDMRSTFDLDTMALRRRKSELGQSTLDSFGNVSGGLVDVISGVGTINNILKTTEFDRKNQGTINALYAGELGQNEFLRNPQQYLQGILSKFPKELISGDPAASAISELLGLLGQNNITNFADVMNMDDKDPRKNQILSGVFKLAKNASGVDSPMREAARVADGLKSMGDELLPLVSGLKDFQLTIADINALMATYAQSLSASTGIALNSLQQTSVDAAGYTTVLGQQIPVPFNTNPNVGAVSRYTQKQLEEVNNENALLPPGTSGLLQLALPSHYSGGTLSNPTTDTSLPGGIMGGGVKVGYGGGSNWAEGGTQLNYDTSRLTNSQKQFVERFAEKTGLNPRVVAAWVLNEMSGRHATSREKKRPGYANWLNVGHTDSGEKGTKNPYWFDINTAADATADWMKGDLKVEGFGRSSKGIRRIMNSVGLSPEEQMSAIQGSGWASGGEKALRLLYSQLGLKGGIPSQSTFMLPDKNDTAQFKQAIDTFGMWANLLSHTNPFTTQLPAGVGGAGAITYLNNAKIAKAGRVGRVTGLSKRLKYPGLGITGVRSSGGGNSVEKNSGGTYCIKDAQGNTISCGYSTAAEAQAAMGGFTDTTAQSSSDLAGLYPTTYAAADGSAAPAGPAAPKIPGIEDLLGIALTNSIGAGIQTFFTTLQAGGSTKEAIDAAFTTLASNIAMGVSDAVGSSIGGAGGAVLGPLAGGLVGWGLSKLFKLNKKPEKDRPQVDAWIQNFPEQFKGNVLPESAYYRPMAGSHGQQVVQNKNQVFQFYDTPQLVSKVAKATSDQELLGQYQRGR